MALRRAAFSSLSPAAVPAEFLDSFVSSTLQSGQRFANPGLSGLSSNSSPQTLHTLMGNPMKKSYRMKLDGRCLRDPLRQRERHSRRHAADEHGLHGATQCASTGVLSFDIAENAECN